MTFGRWLLVHSFSIFLVALLVAGYVYREELRLQQAYHQLLSLGPQPSQQVLDSTPPESAANTGRDEPEVAVPPLSEPPAAARSQPVGSLAQSEQLPATVEQPRDVAPLASPTVEREVIELDALLVEARRAFWDKQFDHAIRSYRQLLEEQPANPDLFGELGNVYYAMNDYQRAAQHYFEAASLLIQSGEISRARQLIAPVTAMDRELGEQLSARLRRTQN